MNIIVNYLYFNKMSKITFEDFTENYRVRRNPVKQVSPYENMLLDMDDQELDYLEAQPDNKVWTLVDDRKSKGFVLKPGMHYRDVIGYFTCEREWYDKNINYSL